jgi:hypothetical protein
MLNGFNVIKRSKITVGITNHTSNLFRPKRSVIGWCFWQQANQGQRGWLGGNKRTKRELVKSVVQRWASKLFFNANRKAANSSAHYALAYPQFLRWHTWLGRNKGAEHELVKCVIQGWASKLFFYSLQIPNPKIFTFNPQIANLLENSEPLCLETETVFNVIF